VDCATRIVTFIESGTFLPRASCIMDPMSNWSDPESNPVKAIKDAAAALRSRLAEGEDAPLDTEARLCLAREQVVMEMGEGVMTTWRLGKIAEQWSTGEPGDRALMTVGLWSDLIDGPAGG
jgi:hypothetical protein